MQGQSKQLKHIYCKKEERKEEGREEMEEEAKKESQDGGD